MIDFASLANAGIRALRAYDPGHDLVALRRAAPRPLLELAPTRTPTAPVRWRSALPSPRWTARTCIPIRWAAT